MRRDIWEIYPYDDVNFAEDQIWARKMIELGYKKLLNHMETISSNNSLINTVITTTTNGNQVLSSANFYKSSFKYDSDNYPTEQVSETALLANGNRGYLKREYFY